MSPFLEIEAFATQYRQPLDAGQTAIAERLLRVASDWIRGRKPDVDEDAAQQVVFEVVRDALLYGDVSKLSSWQNTTSKRTEAGTFDAALAMITAYLTDAHKRLLGIPLRAAPRGHFKRCDY